jgi:hypothetical protein
MGMPVWSSEYMYFSPDGAPGRPATAYAAVRFGPELNIVQTGRVPGADGVMHAWESLTRFGGDPIWFWEYGGENASRGESVIPTPEPCGFAMAGRFTFAPPAGPFARGETYLVKNNDDGETGCLERRWEFRREFEADLVDAPIEPRYRDEFRPAESFLDAADAAEEVFCFDDDCDPGVDPCPCDINGDGILDLTDIGLFVTSFVNQTPPSDIAAPFGVWDLNDVNAFVTCFRNGCP